MYLICVFIRYNSCLYGCEMGFYPSKAIPKSCSIFSWPGRSPGGTIALPPVLALAAASALAKSLTLKFFM